MSSGGSGRGSSGQPDRAARGVDRGPGAAGGSFGGPYAHDDDGAGDCVAAPGCTMALRKNPYSNGGGNAAVDPRVLPGAVEVRADRSLRARAARVADLRVDEVGGGVGRQLGDLVAEGQGEVVQRVGERQLGADDVDERVRDGRPTVVAEDSPTRVRVGVEGSGGIEDHDGRRVRGERVGRHQLVDPRLDGRIVEHPAGHRGRNWNRRRRDRERVGTVLPRVR